MDVRVGFLALLIFAALGISSARQLPLNLQAMNYPKPDPGEAIRNDKVCTLCEEYAAMALDYVGQNKTQKEIIALLHVSCSQLHSFKAECVTLVDYYAPLFFSDISSIQPGEFCKKVNLCRKVATISSRIKEDGCEFCQNAVSEIMDKLNDPDTQMDIIQLLLKACNSMEKYVKKCKRMVFEYGPLIIANAEQFLEDADVCTALHVCAESPFIKEDSLPIPQEAVVLRLVKIRHSMYISRTRKTDFYMPIHLFSAGCIFGSIFS